ncbi:MAG: DUF4248 domain-containing protein [Tannerellaceae bacterium]|nr:DUF4248 domain-containing protein [Tannerellaceae bacterium]
MHTTYFTIKSYGWQELAILYSPEIDPRSATRKLSRWVSVRKDLKEDLLQSGWKKRNQSPDT